MSQLPFILDSVEVAAGSKAMVDLALPRLYTHDAMAMSVQVVHGLHKGPKLFVSSTIHGNELNGIEIIRRVMEKTDPKQLRGTLIAVPIVNVFGLINQTRNLPDRRDLNRSFPGSTTGSLASRVAATFMKHIVANATHGIDIHTAAEGRANLPQIRGNLEDSETLQMAEKFAAPVMIHSPVRDGSLRGSVGKLGMPVLVYEGGEPNRFNAHAIDLGVAGVLRVMKHLGMLSKIRTRAKPEVLRISKSTWLRARQSGFVHLKVKLGDRVKPRQIVAVVQDAFGENPKTLRSSINGVVIGLTSSPLAHRGEAIAHIAEI